MDPIAYLENADVENGHGEEGQDVEQDDGAHCRTLQHQQQVQRRKGHHTEISFRLTFHIMGFNCVFLCIWL